MGEHNRVIFRAFHSLAVLFGENDVTQTIRSLTFKHRFNVALLVFTNALSHLNQKSSKKQLRCIMLLKNEEFQSNFTHPLNYLFLLEEPLLRKLVGLGNSKKNKQLFGFTNMDTPLKYDLSKLKVCFAHYGGAEEWNKFLETDRDYYSQHLMSKPKTGIELGSNADGSIPWVKYEKLWKNTDWYSIVSSMMIQYENFYADISYIVGDTSLYPVLRSTISHGGNFENCLTDNLKYESREKLRSRVLFGSDFYVVRSQKSDKDIFAEIQSFLTEEEFDIIARDNPHEFFSRN